MGKTFFDQIDPKINFPEMEKKILKDWQKKGIVKKYLEKNKSSDKYFSFLDGPITANNPMGIHHAWGRTYKDLWQRYKNMQGYCQRFQNGFDCQGLWVEVEVEKELGLRNKKDIENLVPGDKKASIAKFVNLCKERARKYADIQTEQSKRLGYFMDWENSYYTLSDENNYMIWHFLKKCHEEGLIYKGHDVVPWCPRCETAISQHEMLTEDYKEITHDTVFIEYPVNGKKDTYFLVWTTTPWTLPGNVALAVDIEGDYVEAEGEISGNKYILAKEAAARLKLETIKTFKGKELVNLLYSSPFDNLPRVKKILTGYKHRIIATDKRILPINPQDGTGIVHIACGQGAEDYQLGKKEKLPVIELIDDTAVYLDGMDTFSGQNAKKHPEIIINYIKESGNLFNTQKFTHRYPACWRCKTELVWKVADEWYIAMDIKLKETNKSLREMMINVTKKISWLPEFGLERELDWLNNMHDWLISKKNRYWGLALPIWECSHCHDFIVIGSKEELKEKAANLGEFEGHSPHKPWIDEVKIKCPKCNNPANRILDVGNPWLDAGIVSFSTISKDNKSEPLYKKSRNEFEKWYPADFITESFPGQFKNWFYSLLAMSTVLENKNPFKTVLGFATLLGEDGKPMHKSWGNSIEFNEGADKIGVDVMRWMFVRQNPAENLLFGYKVADETRRKFHLMLWNVYNFFVTYANLDGWQPKDIFQSTINEQQFSILDHWILSRLNQTIDKATNALEKYDAFGASGNIESFVNDLSLWYIRRSRDRVGPGAKSQVDKENFYNTIYFVFTNLCLLLAPFTPYLSEIIYLNLNKSESVHLTDWPKSKDLTKEEINLIEQMKIVREEIVEVVHSKRKEAKIAVKQPLNLATVTVTNDQILEDLLKIAEDELNIKKIILRKGTQIQAILDTKITPELKEEAKVRELIRAIQEERKNMGFDLSQSIVVNNPWLPGNKEQINKILDKTLATSISKGSFKVTKI